MKTNKKQVRMLAGILLAVGAYFIYKKFAKQGKSNVRTGGGQITPEVVDPNSVIQMQVATQSGSLNIRESQSASSPVVGQLKKGEKFFAVQMLGDEWTPVLTADKKSIQGYVSTKFVKPVSTPTNTGGIVNPLSGIRKYQVNISSGSLNLREKPDASSKVVGSLGKGTTVTGILQIGGEWILVEDANKKVGYVSSKYMKQV
jgi:lactocepin